MKQKETKQRFAFSLIEMIGVVAVVAIVAALAAPSVLRQIDEAAWARERSDLAAISNAVVLQILSTKTIPHENSLAQSAANWIRQPMSKVNTTPRRYARAFLVDTNGWFGTTTLPYTQGTAGAANRPVNARLMILSTIAKDLPLTTGRPSSTEFNTIWNTPERVKPAGWTWTGKGEDLVIQRINLEPLFHRLVLVNRDPIQDGTYAIQPAVSSTSLPPGATRAGFFLDGTDVTLMLPEGVPQERSQLTRDTSYAFGGSRWGGDYFGSGSEEDIAEGFAYWAFRFMKAGPAPSAQQGATPEGTVAAMYDFMLVFSLWANKCVDGVHFPQYGSGPRSTTVPEYQLLLDIAGGGTKTDSSFLNDFSGEGGLLRRP